jgi:hypothetical protein
VFALEKPANGVTGTSRKPLYRVFFLHAYGYPVNQVVSVRMAKKQQMRWTDEGAHVVALVRVADLNGELSADAFGHVTRPRRSANDRFLAEPMSLAA